MINVGTAAEGFSRQLRNSRYDRGMIGSEADSESRLLVERHERDKVIGMQHRHGGHACLRQLSSGRLHTAARIEQQDQANGAGLGAEAGDGLGLILIENGKVFGLEAGDDVAVLFHQRLRADHGCGGVKRLCEHDGCQHAESEKIFHSEFHHKYKRPGLPQTVPHDLHPITRSGITPLWYKLHGILIDYQQLVPEYGNHQENYRRPGPEGGEGPACIADCTDAFSGAGEIGG